VWRWTGKLVPREGGKHSTLGSIRLIPLSTTKSQDSSVAFKLCDKVEFGLHSPLYIDCPSGLIMGPSITLRQTMYSKNSNVFRKGTETNSHSDLSPAVTDRTVTAVCRAESMRNITSFWNDYLLSCNNKITPIVRATRSARTKLESPCRPPFHPVFQEWSIMYLAYFREIIFAKLHVRFLPSAHKKTSSRYKA
jgi:hypothetical protein